MTLLKFGLATIQFADRAPQSALTINESAASIDDLLDVYSEESSSWLKSKSVLEMLENWDTAISELVKLRALVADDSPELKQFADVGVLPPVNLPRQVFCTGANYRKHVVDLTIDMGVGPEGLDKEGLRSWAENMMDTRALEGEPYVFTKPVSSIAGAMDALAVPHYDEKPDWELELGVVIGKACYKVTREKAMDHVAGYTVVNDITSRSKIARTDYAKLGTDWLRSKGQPGYLPFGPAIIPACFIPNPSALTLTLTLNGKIMQNEASSDMIFDIPRQIEYISQYAQLLPGDIICTGSPAGNGTHHNRFLKPGDVMIGEINGLGRQVVKIVAR